MNVFSFKYKNDYLFNIISFVFFIISIVALIAILVSDIVIINKILFILLTFVIINVLLILVNNIGCITNGRFTLDKHSFIYESLRNEYTINYQEIEYINKEIYTDNNSFIKKVNYCYKIKIKNAGCFTFKYYNSSLDDAIEELALRANKDIEQ